MKDYFVKLWTDEKAFIGMSRGLILALSGLFMSGKVPFDLFLPEKLLFLVPVAGTVLAFLAGQIRSGGSSGEAMSRRHQ